MESGEKDSLFETIDQESTDGKEQQDSKILYEALVARKDQLGAAAELPENTDDLSSRIHREAERRSQEITSLKNESGANIPEGGRPIPVWIWVLAGLLAAGAIVAWQIWG